MNRVGTLEVPEDLAFQKREWLFERCGWTVLITFILAAVAGLFGSGLFSQATVQTSDNSISLTYSRILRWQTPHFLEVEFRGEGQTREIKISNELMKAWSIQKVVPQPDTVTPGGQHTTYQFSGEGPASVTIEYQAKNIGKADGAIQFTGGRSISIQQFALP